MDIAEDVGEELPIVSIPKEQHQNKPQSNRSEASILEGQVIHVLDGLF